MKRDGFISVFSASGLPDVNSILYNGWSNQAPGSLRPENLPGIRPFSNETVGHILQRKECHSKKVYWMQDISLSFPVPAYMV